MDSRAPSDFGLGALLVYGLQSYAQRLDVTTERTNVGTFVSIDVPGADLGTVPVSINNGGVITGYYLTNLYDVSHGFVRSRDGTIVTFDPQNTIYGTYAAGINSEGEITGWYVGPIDRDRTL